MSVNKLKEKVINWHQHRYPNIDNSPDEQSINPIAIYVLIFYYLFKINLVKYPLPMVSHHIAFLKK